MNYIEEAQIFSCADESLLGILARPERPNELGVVIVVGGPQTRVGSHRQFVLLSRALAAAGYPSLRFDCRGMGDSEGDQRDFEAISPDIGAAIEALRSTCPSVSCVVLWGLCDAAAAALLYWNETRNTRIAGFCLLNPWVRSEATLARAQVKHYFGRRLMQKEFWLKLLRGQMNVGQSIGGFVKKLTQASAKVGSEGGIAFQDRMASALRQFSGRVLLLLSENDYTAKEFLEYATKAESWKGLLELPNLTRVEVKGANHTFSSSALRASVADICLDWLGSGQLSPEATKAPTVLR